MTRIDFYFNVSNKPQLLADLLQSALLKRRQVTVLADDEQHAQTISTSLWQQQPTSFLPNVLANHALVNQAVAAQTPIVVHWQNNKLQQEDMLINLSQARPNSFSQFTQLVELVGHDEQEKIAARARFKFYRDRGYEIKHTDDAKKP